jgi:hypothetical protein
MPVMIQISPVTFEDWEYVELWLLRGRDGGGGASDSQHFEPQQV